MTDEEIIINYNNAMIAGYNAAKSGLSRKSCPHKKGAAYNLYRAWKEGYDFYSPNGQTSIENVFVPHVGGPIRRSYKYGPSIDGSRQATGEFEEFILPFYNPENYIGDIDMGYDFKKKKHIKEENVPTEWNQVFQRHLIHGGSYDVTDIPYHYIEKAETLDYAITDEGLAFVNKHGHDNIYIANGYQVFGIFLFASKPTPLNSELGSYGQGACALFVNCPKSILIVAEDD